MSTMNEIQLRQRYHMIREKVMDGTATVEEANEAKELIEHMQAFEAVREHNPTLNPNTIRR